jgi:hypothetical protein
VLFVGNSYTFGRVDPVMSYNTANVTDLTMAMWLENANGSNEDEPHPWGGIPGVFKKLTDQAGLDYDVSISARNAASLRGHYLNSNPAGWDLRGNIASQRWNTVVLQELSDGALPAGRGANANLANFNTYVDKIEQYVHVGTLEATVPANTAARSSTDVFLYQTWARPDMIGPNGTNANGLFYTAAEGLERMTADLHAAYFDRAAANGNIEDVSPVGDAFLRAVTDGVAMRDPYVPEAGKVNLWHTDYFHPSKYGSYLSAAVHFATITGINPLRLGANEQAATDLGIAPDVAQKLQRVAQAVVAPDTVPPVTTATVSPAPDALGWNTGDVTASFSAVDNPGGSLVDSIVPGNSVTITAEGVTNVTYYAVDRAGQRRGAADAAHRDRPHAARHYRHARVDVQPLAAQQQDGGGGHDPRCRRDVGPRVVQRRRVEQRGAGREGTGHRDHRRRTGAAHRVAARLAPGQRNRARLHRDCDRDRRGREFSHRHRDLHGAAQSAVAGGLELEELGVTAALPQQLLMGAGRLDAAVAHDDDAIGHAHAGEPMRDQHRGLAVRELLEALEHLVLRARISEAVGSSRISSCASRM